MFMHKDDGTNLCFKFELSSMKQFNVTVYYSAGVHPVAVEMSKRICKQSFTASCLYF